jgi:calcium/calmodulin-dependent protein kinase (CaM kinase) II
MNNQAVEVIKLTQSLLEAIFRGDWQEYRNLCAEDITAIEPEGKGHLIEGLGFHHTYFPAQLRNPERDNVPKITISSPHVRIMGDAAVIAYVRLVQVRDDCGAVVTTATEETRVWQRSSGGWKHVHFHRSPIFA